MCVDKIDVQKSTINELHNLLSEIKKELQKLKNKIHKQTISLIKWQLGIAIGIIVILCSEMLYIINLINKAHNIPI